MLGTQVSLIMQTMQTNYEDNANYEDIVDGTFDKKHEDDDGGYDEDVKVHLMRL